MCAMGWPSIVTVTAHPSRSAATTVLGKGTGTGPAGGPGGQRHTSGNATAWPLMNTGPAMAAFIARVGSHTDTFVLTRSSPNLVATRNGSVAGCDGHMTIARTLVSGAAACLGRAASETSMAGYSDITV